jgi:glycerol-3-phosphate acyltransferase PlsY
MTLTVVLIVAAYLAGSIPTAYLTGRWLRGRDLRRYGTGTISASIVWEHAARWATVPVGLFDIAKAALPTWLALRWGLSTTAAVLVGVAAIVGHNWSVFLRFAGGRGVSPFLGVLAVMFPAGAVWMVALLGAGWLLGDSTVWTLVGIVGVPVLSSVLGGSNAVLPLGVVMLGLTVVKRIEANGRPIPVDRRYVIVRRIFFDRDIRSHADWVGQTPDD